LTNDTWEKIKDKIKYYGEYLCKKWNKDGTVISFNNDKLEDIYINYCKYNKSIHCLMLNHDLKNFDALNNELNNRIDRHKVAAALLASIVETQPMQINTINPSPALRTANELLSFLVGIHIIVAFYSTKNNSSHKICLPKCQNEDYSRHFIKIIYHLKTLFEKKVFDVAVLFLVSHIYFLLEQCSLKE
jgi:hypothetical protein